VNVPGAPLHDAESMRATDAAAIAAGVEGRLLMEAAGEAVARVVREAFGQARRVTCVCGGGNNGGDGLVAARLLRGAGVDASCLVVASRPYAGDALAACDAAVAAGVPVNRVGAVGEGLQGADLIIDALLGTGAGGAPRGAVAEAIHAIGAAGVPVVSIDIPSGVDASTGEVPGAAVSADVTVTLHAEKAGLRIMPGLGHAGRVEVAPIGIPPETSVRAPGVIAGADAVAALPPRPRGGSKYDAGMLVCVGGSIGLTGAISLAASAALRAGAGLVVAAIPARLNDVLEVKLTEPMTLPCPDADGALAPAAADAILERASRADAVVLGPGMGRTEGARALARELIPAVPCPLLVDADGLFAVGTDLALLARRTAPTVLTPHGGEAARLLGAPVGDTRLAAARRIAAGAGAICLLKGPDTIIAAPDGSFAIRDGDTPGLATAGTGDVLAGTIGALLARGAEPALAAAAGAVAHLAAAREAVAAEPGRAPIASDLIERLRCVHW
jgi:ADP-dependent NAD(P)H-hydrate dehydratase / NAD(P)H-hydrate epimerase